MFKIIVVGHMMNAAEHLKPRFLASHFAGSTVRGCVEQVVNRKSRNWPSSICHLSALAGRVMGSDGKVSNGLKMANNCC